MEYFSTPAPIIDLSAFPEERHIQLPFLYYQQPIPGTSLDIIALLSSTVSVNKLFVVCIPKSKHSVLTNVRLPEAVDRGRVVLWRPRILHQTMNLHRFPEPILPVVPPCDVGTL